MIFTRWCGFFLLIYCPLSVEEETANLISTRASDSHHYTIEEPSLPDENLFENNKDSDSMLLSDAITGKHPHSKHWITGIQKDGRVVVQTEDTVSSRKHKRPENLHTRITEPIVKGHATQNEVKPIASENSVHPNDSEEKNIEHDEEHDYDSLYSALRSHLELEETDDRSDEDEKEKKSLNFWLNLDETDPLWKEYHYDPNLLRQFHVDAKKDVSAIDSDTLIKILDAVYDASTRVNTAEDEFGVFKSYIREFTKNMKEHVSEEEWKELDTFKSNALQILKNRRVKVPKNRRRFNFNVLRYGKISNLNRDNSNLLPNRFGSLLIKVLREYFIYITDERSKRKKFIKKYSEELR